MWDLDKFRDKNPSYCLNTLFVRYGCGTTNLSFEVDQDGLNTLFVRYGCGTTAEIARAFLLRLNTLFVRYGCGTVRRECHAHTVVLIPYSSGMGVGLCNSAPPGAEVGVLIPYSSGMGVGLPVAVLPGDPTTS